MESWSEMTPWHSLLVTEDILCLSWLVLSINTAEMRRESQALFNLACGRLWGLSSLLMDGGGPGPPWVALGRWPVLYEEASLHEPGRESASSVPPVVPAFSSIRIQSKKELYKGNSECL